MGWLPWVIPIARSKLAFHNASDALKPVDPPRTAGFLLPHFTSRATLTYQRFVGSSVGSRLAQVVTGTPSACNNADYQTKLLHTVKGYAEANGFGELGRRYAHNVANARFLWRNRVGAEHVEVVVQHLVKGEAASTWTFDGLAMSLWDFAAPTATSKDLAALADLMTQGLSGTSHVLLQVTAYARLGAAQEVYPSQELILDNGNSKKSKTLYQVQGVAGRRTVSSLPHRQLRNSGCIIIVDPNSSLPHRQLRNSHRATQSLRSRSLPHRQLRKRRQRLQPQQGSSLPHRQLRN